MWIEWAHGSLIMAWVSSLALMLLLGWGLYRLKHDGVALERLASFGLRIQWVGVTFSFAVLVSAFIANDFTVQYVAEHSHLKLPLIYRMGATWGAHEGSMLLWLWLLLSWSVVSWEWGRRQYTQPEFWVRTAFVFNLIALGFEAFILWTSNPFLRLIPAPNTSGIELNPLLQDIGLIMHPPTLYMGYVGFSVAFAQALALLWGGETSTAVYSDWARRLRMWVLVPWCFLALGITLGSWWAYRELGWGGFWFWDPVENASLMPWLLGTALIHALKTTQREGTLVSWSVLLCIACFSLSVLGTFLVRSGILTSVHSFAQDPTRGVFMFGFLCVLVLGSLWLFAYRSTSFNHHASFSWCSKEVMMLINNFLLGVMVAVIALGTLYPLALEMLHWGSLSVGAPYFNHMIVPLMIPLWAFLGIGMFVPWREIEGKVLLKRLGMPAVLTVLFALISAQWLPQGYSLNLLQWVCWVLLLWVLATHGVWSFRRAQERRPWKMSTTGLLLAHLGVAVTSIGVLGASVWGTELLVRMNIGDSVPLDRYTVTLVQEESLHTLNYGGVGVWFEVRDASGHLQSRIFSEKRLYSASGQIMTDAGIDAGFWRDIYISLGTFEEKAWTVRLYHKPLIRWIWAGGWMMFLGGVAAALGAVIRRAH